MNKLIPFINDFIENKVVNELWYKKIEKHLEAIILFGSVAKGTNRPDSDIDLLFILPIEIEEKYTKGEYFINFKGHEFNIVMRSIEGLRKIAKGEHDDFQAEIFSECYFIWERDSTCRDLIHIIQNK